MLYRPTRSVTDYALLQHDIDSIAWWTDQNFLDFNANKCKYMIISRKLHSNNSHNPLTALMINCTELEQVDSFKYLGVWITSRLSWSKHVTEVCRKARQKVGIFHRKCYQYDNTATMLKLYLTCIRPDLEYAVQVWSPYQKGHCDALEAVQKFALRVCTKKWNMDYHTLLCQLTTYPASQTEDCFFLLFNVIKGNHILPQSLIELREPHHHFTKSHSNTMYHSPK